MHGDATHAARHSLFSCTHTTGREGRGEEKKTDEEKIKGIGKGKVGFKANEKSNRKRKWKNDLKVCEGGRVKGRRRTGEGR